MLTDDSQWRKKTDLLIIDLMKLKIRCKETQ